MEYDIIIVGGGTAGCVLAGRLSEFRVLVIEAGENHNDDPRVKIPALFSQSFGDPRLDYDYKTVPQAALNGKVFGHARGKGIGGSSLINFMGVIYPSKSGFDAWAEMGNPGWDWDSMLPYLKKFQTIHAANGTYGDGPIQASYSAFSDLDKAWVETFRNIGYPLTADTMSGHYTGGFSIVSAVDPKTRERSHAGSYSTRAEIVTGTVEKVIFDGTKAIGVEFNGQKAYAKEIVLCAGSFGSPCILERSGIGPGPVYKNENVGENLQDHYICGVSFEVNAETTDNFRDPNYAQAAMERYQKDRTGPMTSTCVNFAFMSLEETLEIEANDFPSKFTRKLLHDKSEASANMCMLSVQVNFEKDNLKEALQLSNPGNYITIFTALAHPLSRGSVHCSSDPAIPRIDPGYCSNPTDVELLARHVQIIEKLVNTDPLKSFIIPGRRIPEWASFETLEDAKRLIQESAMSNQHPCGTCAMLPREKGGVVDSNLRVYGVSGLRVCDASIIPLITRSNIMTTVYAIAEKGADIIKQDLKDNVV